MQHMNSQTNIISNNAGMGKTFMLKSIANKFNAHEWVFYINLSEHISKLSAGNEAAFIKYLFDYHMNYNDKIVHEFCKTIFAFCIVEGNMVCLLDGYDEVYSENILLFLKNIKENNFRTWITTRPTYARELELQMNTLSVEITHFSQNDHVTFLWKYFETFSCIYNYNQEQIQYVIDSINRCSSNLDKTFIAIPLQTRMFAEIFGDDISQIAKKEELTRIDLYNTFVNIKLKEYKSYEAMSLKKTLSKLALKIFFKEDQLDMLLDFEELVEEAKAFQESYKKDSIVIGLNEKGDAVFGHRTFAEFLAAQWLAKQIVNNRGQYNREWVPLIEKLYYIEMLPVRSFFDRILSQDMPLHLAVLNNDLENVKNVEIKHNLDKLGRSALHLAVSYGRYYDLYVSSGIKGLKNVGLHTVITGDDSNCQLTVPRMERIEYEVSEQIVEYLMSEGLPNSTDKLFNYDAFDYAMKSCSLKFVNCLYSKFEKTSLYFESEYNLKVLVYVVAHENLYRILSERKSYNFDVTQFPQQNENKIRDMFKGHNLNLLKIKYNDFYLTEIAAALGGKEIVFELLQTGILRVDMGYATHKACNNGHADVVDLLYIMGADVEKEDEYGFNPIEQSGRRGRADITYQYLKDSTFMSNLRNNDLTSMTPLHYACQGGHLECVKKLKEIGVNIKIKDAFGYTPLLYTSLYGHSNIIKSLLSGIPKEELESDKNIQLAINVAASNGYSDCVKNLLECGLNVNNLDDDGNTPLILASQKGFVQVIQALANSSTCDINLAKTNETLESISMYTCLNNHYSLQTKLVVLGKKQKSSWYYNRFAFCRT
ncbi:hypothetical protein NQ314_000023 [Rhamnusium bicolor]|uniref:NACHT domain-containing protein n=1 Tax=Rhamnusium bicolor TaxID=1586634 RepID=A0AAV8ZZQ0_9CUCU|nr:hypothetical protein NQ314_000023 [Rhamnusium bicolor]